MNDGFVGRVKIQEQYHCFKSVLYKIHIEYVKRKTVMRKSKINEPVPLIFEPYMQFIFQQTKIIPALLRYSLKAITFNLPRDIKPLPFILYSQFKNKEVNHVIQHSYPQAQRGR